MMESISESDSESRHGEIENTDSDLPATDNQSTVENDDFISTPSAATYTPLSTEDVSSNDQLIYPSARITNAASMILILTFVITHQLSGDALKDLLSLIDIHCLKPHSLIQSLYKFKRYFEFLNNPIKKHHFCSNCCLPLDLECIKCPNAVCNKEYTNPQDKPFFIEIPVVDQLKQLFNRDGFYISLNYRFNRKKKSSCNIEDIYDGFKYKNFMQPGEFLSCHDNISFTWNTDGIPVFKSSKFTIWPLYLAINELPMCKRWRDDNVILAGLWFGHQKPSMLTYLKPFCESMTELYAGVEIYSPDIGKDFTCRAMLLCGTSDLPAKAMVYNMHQYNGEYGCSHCLQPGEQMRTGERGSVHIYPYNHVNPNGPLRTAEGTDEHSREAIATGNPVFGVKGPSWLSVVPGYNVIEGDTVDYMHCVLLGVTKMLLKLWFDSKHSNELWYCGNQIEEADSKLLQIKPPCAINRTPRSIQQHRNYWKASEYRAWLLYYSIPVMLFILPTEYLAHHMLLVEAIHLLLNNSIAPEMLEKAEKLIQHYCFKVQYYYTKRCYTANMHLLLHLPQVVLKYGPLYSYSCFAYEGLNGHLLNAVKGTQHVDQQVIQSLNIKRNLPRLIQSHIVPASDAAIIYEQITSLKCVSLTERDCYEIMGEVKPCSQLSNASHQQALLNTTKNTELGTFNRVKIGSLSIHSKQHKQPKKRNSYTVSYELNKKYHHGEVLYFVKDYSEMYAIIEPFMNHQHLLPSDDITHCMVPHLQIYSSRSGDVHVVPLQSIISQCISITFDEIPNTIFIAEQPNTTEKD